VDFVARTRAAAEAEAERAPISPAHLMHTLAGLLPDDVVIVDESASSLPHVLRHLPFKRPGSFYGSKTGTLGWAMGAAIGVQLADPRRKVVVTIGDGSVMYAPQALWTAAHEGLPITYVVANNTSYAILKAGMATLGLAGAKTGFYPGMDLTAPEVDYVRLAESLGGRVVRGLDPGRDHHVRRRVTSRRPRPRRAPRGSEPDRLLPSRVPDGRDADVSRRHSGDDRRGLRSPPHGAAGADRDLDPERFP